MSLSQDSTATIVCKEVFDETSHPSNEEVLEYAKRLGIDPDVEPHLLGLAQEGLMAALPKGWAPCFHEASGAWYYYQAATGTTTWEHPLDVVYKELAKQARAGNRQASVEDDSRTTAKDLESHEEASLPRDSSKGSTTRSRIPSKFVSTRNPKPSNVGTRKRESSFERLEARRESESKSESFGASLSSRSARDYTNLKFQDPKFYESPVLLDHPKADLSRKELDLKEVLKRSESLSPRYEKDWEQLSSRFSSEENVIDIDKLNINSLTDRRSEKQLERFDKEKHPRQFGQQKELTLSGGGSMFLKSNKNREVVSDTKDDSLAKFRPPIAPTANETVSVVEERPKSILREKTFEDEERPVDEERKSVRFDLEKEVDIKFTYSASEDESDVESEEKNGKAPVVNTCQAKVSQSTSSLDSGSHSSTKEEEEEDSECKQSDIQVKENLVERINLLMKQKPQIIARRFLVENVSENEHFNQISKEGPCDIDYISSRFEGMKKIDISIKSESDSLIGSSDSRSSMLDEIRRSKEIMLENMKRSDHWIKKEMQREKDEIHHLMKIKHDLERTRHEQEAKSKLEYSKNLEDYKLNLSREHEREIQSLRKKFDAKLEQVRNELETDFMEQKRLLEQNLKEKMLKLKKEMIEREEQEMQKLIVEIEKLKVENLKKIRTELEIRYEKERQEIMESLKVELNQKRKELIELKNQEMEKLEKEFEKALGDEKLVKLSEFEVKKQHMEKMEIMKKELEKEFDDFRAELRTQQREKISKITEDHEKCLAEILRDFRMEENLARKVYKQRLEEIRADFSCDTEKEVKKQSERVARQESVDFEKIRCEKRLLEDKYNTLKEKYLKLKADVRFAADRRNRRNEGNTTASETEKSTFTRVRTDTTELQGQKTLLKKMPSNSKPQDNQNQNENGGDESADQRPVGFPKSTSCTKNSQKFESDDTTTGSETNSNLLKKRKSFTKKTASTSKLNNNIENPVENIRKQLEKLEDLGDQLPSNETAYTLRYPFQDKAPVNASSELEFFRHRIHVERDSVKRAREALRQQKSAFQGKQKAWKQRSARATLEQLVQEERELSDMEVSLHRTRSLLGEKMIHLKHLEQSLEKVANARRNENDPVTVKNDELTLSDMSSASSGFSSTDLGTDTFVDKQDHFQESTEIIASLENLNSEIREIWGVLNKRQDNNIPPPPTIMYSDLGWLPYQHLTTQPNNVPAFGTPNIQSNILSQLTAVHSPTTTTQNIIAQYGPNSGYTTSIGTVEKAASSLMERTRNLRDWLRQARIESTDLVSPGQATL